MPPKRQPLKGLTKDLMLGSIDKQEREQLAKQGGVASPTPVAPDPDTSPSQDAIETFLKAVNATNVKKVVYCFPERWLPTQHKFEALRGEQCTALWKYMSHQLASVRVEAEKSLKMRLKKEREAKARAAGERPYADLAYDDALAVARGLSNVWQPSFSLLKNSLHVYRRPGFVIFKRRFIDAVLNFAHVTDFGLRRGSIIAGYSMAKLGLCGKSVLPHGHMQPI